LKWPAESIIVAACGSESNVVVENFTLNPCNWFVPAISVELMGGELILMPDSTGTTYRLTAEGHGMPALIEALETMMR
jgi:hypothetical protein